MFAPSRRSEWYPCWPNWSTWNLTSGQGQHLPSIGLRRSMCSTKLNTLTSYWWLYLNLMDSHWQKTFAYLRRFSITIWGVSVKIFKKRLSRTASVMIVPRPDLSEEWQGNEEHFIFSIRPRIGRAQTWHHLSQDYRRQKSETCLL